MDWNKNKCVSSHTVSARIQEFLSMLVGCFWPTVFLEAVVSMSARDAFIWRFDWGWCCFYRGSVPWLLADGLSSSPCGSLHRVAQSPSTSQSEESRREQGSIVMTRQGGVALQLDRRLSPSKSSPGPRNRNHLFTCYVSLCVRHHIKGTMTKKETDGSYFLTFEGGRQASNQAMKTQCEEGPPWWSRG